MSGYSVGKEVGPVELRVEGKEYITPVNSVEQVAQALRGHIGAR